MDFRKLHYFAVLTEERHFGRAARRLSIVQPALSLQIRSLEEELGGQLFFRTSRQVDLTPVGELFLEKVRPLLIQAEHAKAVVQSAFRGELGTLRVGFSCVMVFTEIFAEDIRKFKEAYPKVELELKEMPPLTQYQALLTGDIDVGYALALDSEADPHIISREIGSWSYVAAMRPDHKLANKKILEPCDFGAGETIILYSPDEYDTTKSAGHFKSMMPDDSFEIRKEDSLLNMVTLAAAGLGVVIMPSPISKINIPDVTFRPLVKQSWPSKLFTIRRAREVNPVVHAFWNLICGNEMKQA